MTGRHVVSFDAGDVPAALNLLRATIGWCETDQLIVALWIANQRIGVPVGDPQAPADNGEHHLCCRACGATWVGDAHEACGWCFEGQLAQRLHQEEMDRP